MCMACMLQKSCLHIDDDSDLKIGRFVRSVAHPKVILCVCVCAGFCFLFFVFCFLFLFLFLFCSALIFVSTDGLG